MGPEGHPSEMVERPGLLLSLLSAFVYARVTVAPADVDRLRRQRARAGGRVVYASRSLSLLDYLFWNHVFAQNGLPLCRYAVGVFTTPFRPLAEAWRRWRHDRAVIGAGRAALADCVRRGEPAFLFLGKPRTLTQRTAEFARDHFREILDIQRDDPDAAVLIVPLQVMWRPRPQTLRPSLLDSVLGSAEAPGRIRKVLSVLLSSRQAQVQVGEAVDLAALLADPDRAAEAEAAPEALARKVRGAVHLHLARTARAAIGPRVKDRRRLIDEIVRGLRTGGELAAVADRTGRSPGTLADEARQQLDGIAADFRWGVLRFLHWVLAPVWRRIYDGLEIDAEGLRRVEDAARITPLVLLPTHKSHVDYMMLSWVFADRGLMPPLVAAGANLDFFPVGLLFRRAGAFFLRRSFRGDSLYPVVFRAYMRKLLREGHSLEFFIEGGRSRSGKVLRPKLGLLTYVLDGVIDPGGARDVHIVPVSIGYERIVEAAAYERELQGGEKEAESARGLLQARKVLARRYGRLYLEFDAPFSLRAWLAAHGLPEDAHGPDACPPERRSELVRDLAFDVAGRLQRNSTVTPVSLVATVLLSHPRRGIDRRSLLVKVGCLEALAEARGARFSRTVRMAMAAAEGRVAAAAADPLSEAAAALADAPDPQAAPGSAARGEALAHVVDEALGLFGTDRSVEARDYGAEADAVYVVRPDRRLRLDFHRNGLTPLFAGEAIAATALLAGEGRPDSQDACRDDARTLSRLLRHEFVFPVDRSFDDLYDAALASLRHMALLDEGGRPAPGAGDALRFFRATLQPLLEAYLAVAASGARGGEKALVQAADRLYQRGDIDLPEARSGVTLRNARGALNASDAAGLRETAGFLGRLLR